MTQAFDPAKHCFGMAYSLSFTTDKYPVYPIMEVTGGHWLFYDPSAGAGRCSSDCFIRTPRKDLKAKLHRNELVFNPDWACKDDCIALEVLRERNEHNLIPASEVRPLVDALVGLVDGAKQEFNEKGAGGFALARLSDAKQALSDWQTKRGA